jgi:hypothetical protein
MGEAPRTTSGGEMEDTHKRTVATYSILVERTVMFWERAEVDAETAEAAIELMDCGACDWSKSRERKFYIYVEKDGEFVGDLILEP